MKKAPSTVWKNIKEETLKNNVANPILLELMAHLKERKESLEAQDRTEDTYDKASWSHLQAHRNGRAQELHYIIQLLSFAETKR